MNGLRTAQNTIFYAIDTMPAVLLTNAQRLFPAFCQIRMVFLMDVAAVTLTLLQQSQCMLLRHIQEKYCGTDGVR